MFEKTVTTEEMKLLDRMAIEEKKIPSMFLMEKAGLAIATEVGKAMEAGKRPVVCFVCGVGNNAGDGFVAARFLMNAGIQVKIFIIGNVQNFKEDASVNYRGLKQMGCEIFETDTILPEDLQTADIVVDALFGIGIDREIKEPYKSIIDSMNAYSKFIISADIPSGLDGTTGNIWGVCVKADVTVTFHLPKQGLCQNQGPAYAGKIVVADIGIPSS